MRSCLAATKAQILQPSDPSFAAASRPLNERIHRRPGLLMFARSTADVQAAVRCGLMNNVRVVPRSGGHSYEGKGSSLAFLFSNDTQTACQYVGHHMSC